MGKVMQASVYCTKCKTKKAIKAAEVIFALSNESTYICADCKKVSHA